MTFADIIYAINLVEYEIVTIIAEYHELNDLKSYLLSKEYLVVKTVNKRDSGRKQTAQFTINMDHTQQGPTSLEATMPVLIHSSYQNPPRHSCHGGTAIPKGDLRTAPLPRRQHAVLTDDGKDVGC